MRLAATFAALGIALVGLSAFALNPLSTSADTTIETGSNWYCSPSFSGGTCTTNITTGETVTWSLSQGSHTITECNPGPACPKVGGFDSDGLDQGQTYSRQFTTAGSYDYYCAFHPSDMFGVIVVTDPSPSPTPAPTQPGQTAGPTQTLAGQPAAPARSGGELSDGASSLWLLLAGLGVAVMLASGTLAFAAVRRR